MIFEPGKIVATPAALDAVPAERVTECLQRHVHGDWGSLCGEDCEINEMALRTGHRLMSVYPIHEGGAEKFYIITEGDRSATTVLLPDDY
jgi:hypothetical protein